MHKNTQTIRPTDTWFKSLFKLIDAGSIGVGLFLLLQWYPRLDSEATLVSFLIALGIFGLLAEFFGLYRNWQGIRFEREATCSLIVWAITLMCLAALGSLSSYTTELSIDALLCWFGFTPVISLSARIWFRWILAYLVWQGLCTRTFAVVGINQLAIQLVRNIKSSPELGLKFIGFFDDRPDERTSEIPQDLEDRLGRVSDLVEQAKSNGVNVVFITLPLRAEDRIRSVIRKLSDSTISVYVVPDLFVFQLLHSRWSDIQGVPVVSVFENPFYGVDGILKRAYDVILATAGILLSVIPMIIIGALVKLTSRGPMLFRQRRYGLDGREFYVWKFRTMTVCEDGDVVQQAQKHDSRITKIGGFLRRSSLDELPQLFNVFFGSMSLVGPRPHATAHNELYRGQIDGYMLRHKVKPGITGLAQVNGCRGQTETLDKMSKRIEFDHQYIRDWSIWLDLRIIWQTLFVVFSKKNAY